jgi:hypothetical protein
MRLLYCALPLLTCCTHYCGHYGVERRRVVGRLSPPQNHKKSPPRLHPICTVHFARVYTVHECRMHVASIYVLIPVQNIAETIAGLYFALYSAAVFCTGMSTPRRVSGQARSTLTY